MVGEVMGGDSGGLYWLGGFYSGGDGMGFWFNGYCAGIVSKMGGWTPVVVAGDRTEARERLEGRKTMRKWVS